MRPLGARQELLLRVMLQDTYRGPGLTCSVMLSLERRWLVERRLVMRQGEQAARVCRMKLLHQSLWSWELTAAPSRRVLGDGAIESLPAKPTGHSPLERTDIL